MDLLTYGSERWAKGAAALGFTNYGWAIDKHPHLADSYCLPDLKLFSFTVKGYEKRFLALISRELAAGIKRPWDEVIGAAQDLHIAIPDKIMAQYFPEDFAEKKPRKAKPSETMDALIGASMLMVSAIARMDVRAAVDAAKGAKAILADLGYSVAGPVSAKEVA